MKLLHVISSVNPRSGGVIEYVLQMSAVHEKMGVDVSICCLDAPDAEWVVSSKFKICALGPSSVIYGFNRELVSWLKIHANEYDAVIVNGLWQYIGLAVWRALSNGRTPYFVYPHGMLGPWFKKTYPLKHLKKWLYWPWAEYRVLRDARRVIFTCDEERLLARDSFWLYKVNEAICGGGINIPHQVGVELQSKFIEKFPLLTGKRVVLFLGRIHKVKGCDLLIEAFAKVVSRDKRLHLVIAGPDQTGWGVQLKQRVIELGLADRITWTGMLEGDMKWAAFSAAEVFCLPSHHENFGVVVVEALACGKPVLISNKVNIWREIESSRSGLVAEDTLAGTIQNLERWLAMSTHEYEAMVVQTKITFAKEFHVDRVAQRLLEIIEESK